MFVPLVGVPGGTELLVIVVVSVLLFSPLVALVYLFLFRERIAAADEERIDDLEAEVADLRERLDDGDGEGNGDADGD